MYDEEEELAQLDNYLMLPDLSHHSHYFNAEAGAEPFGLSELAEIDGDEEGSGLSLT